MWGEGLRRSYFTCVFRHRRDYVFEDLSLFWVWLFVYFVLIDMSIPSSLAFTTLHTFPKLNFSAKVWVRQKVLGSPILQYHISLYHSTFSDDYLKWLILRGRKIKNRNPSWKFLFIFSARHKHNFVSRTLGYFIWNLKRIQPLFKNLVDSPKMAYVLHNYSLNCWSSIWNESWKAVMRLHGWIDWIWPFISKFSELSEFDCSIRERGLFALSVCILVVNRTNQ